MGEGKEWLSPPHEFWLDPRLVNEGVWPKAMVCPGLRGIRLGYILSGLQGSALMGLDYSEWHRLRGHGGALSLRGQGWGGWKDLGVRAALRSKGGFLKERLFEEGFGERVGVGK